MAEIVEVQKNISLELNTAFEGTSQIVLVENNSEGIFSGRSRLDKLVYLDGKDVEIGDGTKIEAFSHIANAKIGDNCSIGPYARLREGSKIEDSGKVGNFVETKNTTLGSGSKANHFTYLGDTTVGTKTNIGAGTITCNYDGKNKHKTIVGDNSFIGSNSSLVAPVKIGNNTTIAAGSTITKDVPSDALGFGRAKQSNKDNWSKKKG